MDNELAAALTELVEKVGLLRRDMQQKKDLEKYEGRIARIEQKFSALAELISRTDPELALYGRYVVSRRLREEGFYIHDVYTPYAVHGLDRAMGLRPSRLPVLTFIAGFLAMSLAMGFQLWSGGINWVAQCGGKTKRLHSGLFAGDL